MQSEAKRWKDQGVNDTDSVTQPSRGDFVYEPLDHSSDSIRIIELHPDSPDAIVRCTMRHVSLSEAKYTCLSYTWQPSHPQHVIEVNGRSLSVGENLYQFLRAYRNHQTRELPHPHLVQSHTLWIDAICIRQAGTNEKNHQVRQMGQIYKNAARVLVWLGSLDHPLKRFLAHMHALANFSDDSTKEDAADWSPWWTILKKINGRIERHLHACDSAQILDLRDQSAALCSNQYWKRVWIAQEIILPSIFRVFVFDGHNCHEMAILGHCVNKINK